MANCIHHWDLGTSYKGIVHAKCRKCLAEKDFYNIPVPKGADKDVYNIPVPKSVTSVNKKKSAQL